MTRLVSMRHSAVSALVVSVVTLVAYSATRADEEPVLPAAASAVTMPDGQSLPTGCLFVPKTVIPRMAMGVCRLDMTAPVRNWEQLKLWNAPPLSVENKDAAGEQSLFKPFFVYAEHGTGTHESKWYLLATEYAAPAEPTNRTGKSHLLGWASGAQLQLLASRYAYSYMNMRRENPVALYETAQDAYEAIEIQSRDRKAGVDAGLVFVNERPDREFWDPRNLDSSPPFIELPAAANDLTDTTLTFAVAPENRLLHVGAVCGGPIMADVTKMEERLDAHVRVAIQFVIDGTQSMEDFYPSIADFVGKVANVDNVDMTAGVVWYRDDGVRDPATGAAAPVVIGGGLNALTIAEAETLAERIRSFKVVTPEPPGDQPEELMLDGLEAGIETSFAANRAVFAAAQVALANAPDDLAAQAAMRQAQNKLHDLALVIVIGDTGDRREGPNLEAKIARLGKLAAANDLRFVFIRTGTGTKPYHTSFDEQAASLANAPGMRGRVDLPRQGGIKDAAALTGRMREIVAELQQEQGRLRRELNKIRIRNKYSFPGPRLDPLVDRAFGSRRAFDERNLQCFVPAFGWLHHPLHPDGEPQLRELAFLAKPEANALVAMFRRIADGLPQPKIVRLDADAAITVFAADLERLSRHPHVKAAVISILQAMPAEEGKLGLFLRDAFGLRLTNPLLYHQGPLAEVDAKRRAATKFSRMADRLNGARKLGPNSFWYDSWKVFQVTDD